MTLKIIIYLLLLSLSTTTSAIQPTKGPLHPIELQEFLKFSKTHQAMYVGGAIDGMTFVSYNQSIKDHDALVDCYRRLPIGEFTSKVVELAKSKINFKENVATLVALTAGKLCKK